MDQAAAGACNHIVLHYARMVAAHPRIAARAVDHRCVGLRSVASSSVAGVQLRTANFHPSSKSLRRSEANFLYLLVGSQKALLIDTGAVADPAKMPLAQT